MKIKITSADREIEGIVTEVEVKPFGSSAHIVMPKRHFGKIVNVIIPNNPQYVWILSDTELNEVMKVCYMIAVKENGKLEQVKLEAINNLKKTKFNIDDLLKVLEMLKKSPNHQHLVKKIQNYYHLQ